MLRGRGFPYLKVEDIGFLVSKFLGFKDDWFQSVLVSKFLGFLILKFQNLKDPILPNNDCMFSGRR